jgi:hypothetical protein
MTTMTAPKSFDYSYGDTVTTISIPLKNSHRYTTGQQSLIDTAIAAGWTLDLTAIENTYSWHGSFSNLPVADRVRYLEQHPFTFVKPAADGGCWVVELDYRDREFSYSSRRSFNKTLKGARLSRIAPDGMKIEFEDALSGYASRNYDNLLVLEKQSTASYASVNWVYAVTTGTMRDRVTQLLQDPAAVVQRAADAMKARKLADAAEMAEYNRQQELKRRPMPEGWSELKSAARAVVNADGISDTAALLVALKAAVAAVEGAVVR